MKQDALQDAEKYTKVHQRKKRWYQVVIVLACVVVFCTTYALILPAITLEKSQCEIPEHTHTESCYTQTSTVIVKDPVCSQDSLSIHKHTDACCNSEGDLTCGKADYIVHQHDDACYDAEGKLWCTLPEVTFHTHNASCYEKLSGHTHTEECYELVRGELTCGQDESDEHQHTDECYSKEKILTCTLSTDPQLKLICGKEEIILHQHTADCYDSNNNLICEKLEVLEHQHTDACFEITEEPVFTLTCGMEEHTHSEACTETSENGISMLSEDDSEDEAELLSDTEETTRSDLSKYIGSDTKFTSATYDPEKDQVEVGFHMTFAMDKKTIQDANYKFTYILPNGLTIPDDMVGKTYEGRDTSGAKGFTYQFVKNEDGTYSVQIDFIQTYVDERDNFSGYIDFSAYAGEEAWQEGGGYEFKFSDDVTVTIPVSEIKQEADESIHYNIDVSKSNSGYDAATNKITYTITVDTSKGTPDPLNLTDILTAQGLEVDKVEIGSVTRVDYTNEWGTTDSNTQKTLNTGTGADQYTFTYDSTNGITMTLPGLTKGDYKYGQKYTITYDVYLKEPPAGASYTVDNKVTVTGTDSSKGETVTDSAETTTSIDKSLDLQKYGSYDKSTGKIQWTIKVNQNGNNIAGATLTDAMFAGQTVTVSPNSGYTLSGDTITFSGVNGDTNTQAYTITYETDAPVVGDDGTATVENTASVIPKGGGTSKDVTAEVKIDKNLKMVKTGIYDKATDTITWTITVNENGNDIAGAELTDTMFSSVKDGDITVSPNQDGMSIVKDETTGTIQKITFRALEGGTTNTQTYTITYATPSGIDPNTSGTVTNTAMFDVNPGEEGGEITSNPGVWVDRTVDLDKSNAWHDSTNNQLHWSISVNNNKNNIVDYTLTDDMFSQIVDGTLVIKLGYNSVDLTSDTNGFTINRDESDKITSITFTEYDETGANTNHYTIEYCTEAKPGWDSVTVTNTATLTPPDGTPITDTGTGTIPADGSVYKKCQGATALVPGEEDSNITITWRTEINVPADGLPAGTVVTDTLADRQWMDWLQIQKWGSVLFAKQTDGTDYIQDINYWWPQGETYDITFYDTDGNSYTYADIVSNNGVQGKKFVRYEIKFPNGVPADIYGGKTIYFEYESYADVSSVTDSATYKNTVSVTPPNGTSKSSEASYTYKAPGVVKMDGDGNTGTTNIVTTNGELTWKVRVRLGADCTTLTVTDTLPEGVTLTGLIFANQALTIGTDGSITGTLEGLTISEDSKVTIDESANKQTLNLTVTVPKDGTTPDYLKANGEFYVVYTCKI
ncbi:MAG: collagen binding domain-containing protein, partial [Fusicatenibacter sp.]|nr:collagen binding domain-containing protein [Fusicatenibacter sp.]